MKIKSKRQEEISHIPCRLSFLHMSKVGAKLSKGGKLASSDIAFTRNNMLPSVLNLTLVPCGMGAQHNEFVLQRGPDNLRLLGNVRHLVDHTDTLPSY